MTLDTTDQYNFKAGDTIGLSWTNYGNIPYDYVNEVNYCVNNSAVTTFNNGTISMSTTHGSREYSLQAIYT